MSDFVRGVVGKTIRYAAFAFCGGMALILLFEYYYVGKFANDFGVYWRTANSPVTEAYFWPGRFPFPYAPTMLIWIQPLSLVAKWPAFFLFGALSALALFLAIRPHLSKSAIALTLISPPFARGIFTGQVSAVVAALTIWACGTANRAAAGVAFGLIASVKPQLVIMAPLMLAFNKDWRAFVYAGLTFAATVILSLVLFGPERWAEWVASMDHFRNAVAGTNVIRSGVSPAVIAERFGFPPLPFLMLGTLAGAVTVYLCRDSEPIEKAAAITLGSIMAAPYALAYDLTGAVPFLALCVMRGKFIAAFGIGGTMNPVPIIAATYELLRGKQWRYRETTRPGSTKGSYLGSALESRSGP